jgi:hypothetical protein
MEIGRVFFYSTNPPRVFHRVNESMSSNCTAEHAHLPSLRITHLAILLPGHVSDLESASNDSIISIFNEITAAAVVIVVGQCDEGRQRIDQCGAIHRRERFARHGKVQDAIEGVARAGAPPPPLPVAALLLLDDDVLDGPELCHFAAGGVVSQFQKHRTGPLGVGYRHREDPSVHADSTPSVPSSNSSSYYVLDVTERRDAARSQPAVREEFPRERPAPVHAPRRGRVRALRIEQAPSHHREQGRARPPPQPPGGVAAGRRVVGGWGGSRAATTRRGRRGPGAGRSSPRDGPAR